VLKKSSRIPFFNRITPGIFRQFDIMTLLKFWWCSCGQPKSKQTKFCDCPERNEKSLFVLTVRISTQKRIRQQEWIKLHLYT